MGGGPEKLCYFLFVVAVFGDGAGSGGIALFKVWRKNKSWIFSVCMFFVLFVSCYLYGFWNKSLKYKLQQKETKQSQCTKFSLFSGFICVKHPGNFKWKLK